MNRRTRAAVALIGAGAIGAGGFSVAAAAAGPAGPGQPSVATAGGWGDGGPGRGPHGAGTGPGAQLRDGSCLTDTSTGAPAANLSEQQRTTLAAMAEEEKLAHDLYQALGEKYPAAIFDRIAAAETQHLSAVRTLLDRYGVTDPTAGRAVGEFANADTKATYDRLLAQGSAGLAAALKVGVTVEQADINDLQQAISSLPATDVRQVYEHLRTASQHHLTAFENWANR